PASQSVGRVQDRARAHIELPISNTIGAVKTPHFMTDTPAGDAGVIPHHPRGHRRSWHTRCQAGGPRGRVGRQGKKKLAPAFGRGELCSELPWFSVDYESDAPTLLKVVDSFVPTIFMEASAAMEINAARSPYSIAVAPDSSLIKFIMCSIPLLFLRCFTSSALS